LSFQNTVLVTAVASIVSIIVIGLIVAPLFTKAETRRYVMIKFFLEIPKETLIRLVKNCEYCFGIATQSRYLEI
jgi:hypothetical protein